MNDLNSALAAAGIPLHGQPEIDGRLHRYRTEGDHDANCWYVIHQKGDIVAGAFGCWKRGLNQKWSSRNGDTLSKEERQNLARAWAESQNARASEEKRLHAEAATKARAIFSTGSPATTHGYLTKKGVKAFGNLRIVEAEHVKGWLAIPLIDEQGVIHSAQFIADDGAKKFLFGGRVKGCFFPLCDKADGPLVICEGYATGATIHEATGWGVTCAMDCGNLLATARAMRSLFPERPLILASDDDTQTDGNPGLTKATEAAKAVKGALIKPEFSDWHAQKSATDFNDLATIAGLAEVKRQVSCSVEPWFGLVEDGAELQARELPPIIEIVEGIVAEFSKLSIVSSAKCFKTWLTIYLGLAISHKVEFLGRRTIRRRVLYVNLELKPATFARRLQAIATELGITIDPKWFSHLSLRGRLAGLTVDTIVTRIIGLAKSIGATVVIVDPLFKLNIEGEENSSRDQTVFCNQLDRITTEGRCTAIFNDHSGKGNQSEKDPLDVIRGSSAKGGDLDAAMVLRKHEVEGCFRVDLVHRELAPVPPFVIGWEFPVMRLRPDLDPDNMKKPKGGRNKTKDPLELLALIRKTSAEKPISISAWAALADMKRPTLIDYVRQMRVHNWISTAGEGSAARQFITKKGLEALA